MLLSVQVMLATRATASDSEIGSVVNQECENVTSESDPRASNSNTGSDTTNSEQNQQTPPKKRFKLLSQDSQQRTVATASSIAPNPPIENNIANYVSFISLAKDRE